MHVVTVATLAQDQVAQAAQPPEGRGVASPTNGQYMGPTSGHSAVDRVSDERSQRQAVEALGLQHPRAVWAQCEE